MAESLVKKVSTELPYVIPTMSYDIQKKLDAPCSNPKESQVGVKVKIILINEATEATFIGINAEQSVSAPQLIQLIRVENIHEPERKKSVT
jgi:hypothetical protein